MVATLQPSSDVDFVDLGRAIEIDRGRVKQFARALDAPPERSVGNVEFSVQLTNTRVELEERVNCEHSCEEVVDIVFSVWEDVA